MKIAKIVSSNSHIAYIGRVLEERDGVGIPSADDYGFGRFVSIPANRGAVIGVICDSRLVNPEYTNYGPRTTTMPALGELNRDLVDEKKALVGILLLGTLSNDGAGVQEIPRHVIPAGQFVLTMDESDISRFHRDSAGSIQLRYFPNLLANAGSLAVSLAKTMIGQIAADCTDVEKQRLEVMANALTWKQTFGDLRV